MKEIEGAYVPGSEHYSKTDELARLRAVNAELMAALEMALAADQDSALWRDTARAAIANAREGAK